MTWLAWRALAVILIGGHLLTEAPEVLRTSETRNTH
jgi:hypothetical protein